MKVDIISTPEPLRFGKGAESFALKLRRWSDVDRALVFDAVASESLLSMQVAVTPLVIGWEGVTDKADIPVPFEKVSAQGRTESNFGAVMGAVSPDIQVEVVLGIVAFIGIPVGDVERRVAALRPPGDLRPTTTQDSATPSPASNG